MDKKYRGFKDNGQWEDFMASSEDQATPGVTGYMKVFRAEDDQEIYD